MSFYKTLLVFLLLNGICFSQDVLNTEDSSKINKNYISSDVLFFIFGAKNVSYEHIFLNCLSTSASIAFGKIFFTDIINDYSLRLRYYGVTKKDIGGMFVDLSFSNVKLKYNDLYGDAKSILFGFGFKWIKFKHLFIEGELGASISFDNQIDFEKQEGNLTKTVSIGGLRFSSGLGLGFTF
jgi:hypothetical protein